MSEESKKALGYDPIEEDELAEEPMSSSHTDLPDPSGRRRTESEDPELRERMERARERIRRRDAAVDRPDEKGSA